jgi:formylglycine-generating enzyme required for sulfatase activity
MIALNPATFRMGNPAGTTGSDARPAHDVTLPAFMISSREITFRDYDRFVRATGARRPNDFGFGRGDQPVVDVTWDEAVAYTRWLSRHTGRGYRLPTEAEWEYAARAGTRSMYWWGFDAPAGRAVCFDCGSRYDRISPAPAGFSGPNPFGVYDTAGNVYEWVADCYRPGYRDAPADGSAVNELGCERRVARGGSFKTPTDTIRVYARRPFEPDTRVDMIGFRVARDAG